MVIDGININSAHFAAMPEDEAVKRMVDDGFVPGETDKEKKEWAKNAYSLISPKTKPVKNAGNTTANKQLSSNKI